MTLGAEIEGDGVRFAVYSGVADAVELCVFDDAGAETRVPLEPGDGEIWQTQVPGAGHGLRYGYRVHGPGRCDPAKLLLDPYARAIAGGVSWHEAVLAPGVDSAPYVPRSIVHAAPFDWGDDHLPRTPLADSIFYELHVKGFTKLHPDLAPELRGTFAGMAHPAVVEHLIRLGVTAVELLPVHQFVHDRALVARGLRNYWGYQPIGYFAPHDEYGSVDDFKAMVKALHAAGLEVILDVVYNHTAEGGEDGPTLCFRGLDDAAYYRLRDDGAYVDDTGCGNTLDTHRPQGLRLVMDSLRYWVQEMHVDGFRFDLAASLGRQADDFDPYGGFLDAAGQDPVLAEVKLIAEPWDTGQGGYVLGNFPRGWSEWNGGYRDTVRDFWRGTPGTLADVATRITGSADLYGNGRRPTASVNLVTVHDGFTLSDLVSYDAKHNEANGEDNRDGSDDNRSWNCGVEGPTGDAAVLALRARQRRNLLATLLLSEGVPLLLAGDELGRTQGGNNNGYCQDNAISWVDWATADEALVAFVERLIRVRRELPVLRRTQFFAPGDLRWLRPDGTSMDAGDWSNPQARAFTVAAANGALLVNAWWEPLTFRLPGEGRWTVEVDTADPRAPRAVADTIELAGRSLALLSAPGSSKPGDDGSPDAGRR
jgi:glycogen operon protein